MTAGMAILVCALVFAAGYIAARGQNIADRATQRLQPHGPPRSHVHPIARPYDQDRARTYYAVEPDTFPGGDQAAARRFLADVRERADTDEKIRSAVAEYQRRVATGEPYEDTTDVAALRERYLANDPTGALHPGGGGVPGRTRAPTATSGAACGPGDAIAGVSRAAPHPPAQSDR